MNSGTSRPYGEAELLVEASFADLRHGGDGDLTKAYKLVEKVTLCDIGIFYVEILPNYNTQ